MALDHPHKDDLKPALPEGLLPRLNEVLRWAQPFGVVKPT
jgi:hypothetical protein